MNGSGSATLRYLEFGSDLLPMFALPMRERTRWSADIRLVQYNAPEKIEALAFVKPDVIKREMTVDEKIILQTALNSSIRIVQKGRLR